MVPLETRVCCRSAFGLSWYGGAPRPVEVLREAGDAGENLHGGEVHVGTLARPIVDDAVDFVGGGHPSIIDRQVREARETGLSTVT
jgi:hypothetical protein